MVQADAQRLWRSIEEYAESREALGAEGNSGEFHEEEEEKRLISVSHERGNELAACFSDLTGYIPTLAWDGAPICARHLVEKKLRERNYLMRKDLFFVAPDDAVCQECGEVISAGIHPLTLLDEEEKKEWEKLKEMTVRSWRYYPGVKGEVRVPDER